MGKMCGLHGPVFPLSKPPAPERSQRMITKKDGSRAVLVCMVPGRGRRGCAPGQSASTAARTAAPWCSRGCMPSSLPHSQVSTARPRCLLKLSSATRLVESWARHGRQRVTATDAGASSGLGLGLGARQRCCVRCLLSLWETQRTAPFAGRAEPRPDGGFVCFGVSKQTKQNPGPTLFGC